METKRVFLIVLDSFGIGHARDADKFNDEGSDTLGTIRRSRNYYTPNMERLGLFHIDGVGGADSLVVPQGAFGRMQEASQREGYDNWTLGNSRPYFKKTNADLSKGISG